MMVFKTEAMRMRRVAWTGVGPIAVLLLTCGQAIPVHGQCNLPPGSPFTPFSLSCVLSRSYPCGEVSCEVTSCYGDPFPTTGYPLIDAVQNEMWNLPLPPGLAVNFSFTSGPGQYVRMNVTADASVPGVTRTGTIDVAVNLNFSTSIITIPTTIIVAPWPATTFAAFPSTWNPNVVSGASPVSQQFGISPYCGVTGGMWTLTPDPPGGPSASIGIQNPTACTVVVAPQTAATGSYAYTLTWRDQPLSVPVNVPIVVTIPVCGALMSPSSSTEIVVQGGPPGAQAFCINPSTQVSAGPNPWSFQTDPGWPSGLTPNLTPTMAACLLELTAGASAQTGIFTGTISWTGSCAGQSLTLSAMVTVSVFAPGQYQLPPGHVGVAVRTSDEFYVLRPDGTDRRIAFRMGYNSSDVALCILWGGSRFPNSFFIGGEDLGPNDPEGFISRFELTGPGASNFVKYGICSTHSIARVYQMSWDNLGRIVAFTRSRSGLQRAYPGDTSGGWGTSAPGIILNEHAPWFLVVGSSGYSVPLSGIYHRDQDVIYVGQKEAASGGNSGINGNAGDIWRVTKFNGHVQPNGSTASGNSPEYGFVANIQGLINIIEDPTDPHDLIVTATSGVFRVPARVGSVVLTELLPASCTLPTGGLFTAIDASGLPAFGSGGSSAHSVCRGGGVAQVLVGANQPLTGISVAGAPWLRQAVQSNGPKATLLLNQTATAGFHGTFPALMAPAAALDLAVSGLPGMPFLLAIGTPLEPGIQLPPLEGTLNLALASLQLAIDTTLPPGGTWSVLGVDLSNLPRRLEVTAQALVFDGGDFTFTAPSRFMTVPGSPHTSPLTYRGWTSPHAGYNRHGVVDDFNNDGLQDYAGTSAIFLGTGDPTSPFVVSSVDPCGIEMASGDLVGDSNVDLVVVDDRNDFRLRIFRGDGTGNFWGVSPAPGCGPGWPTGPNLAVDLPYQGSDTGDLQVVDLDGDGDQDIVAAGGLPLFTPPAGFPAGSLLTGITIFENLGGSQFTPHRLPQFSICQTVAVADLNADGLNDIVVGEGAGATGGTSWIAGVPGAGATTSIAGFLTAGAQALPSVGMPEAGSRWLRARDMDGNGRIDLLWMGDTSVGVLMQDSSGVYSYSPIPVQLPGGLPQFAPYPRMEAWDADADGLMDTVFVDNAQGPLAYAVVARQTPPGVFTTAWYFPVPPATTAIGLAQHALPIDINGSGAQDLLIGGNPFSAIIN